MKALTIKEVARMGGLATLKKRGKKHYQQMGKASWKSKQSKLTSKKP
jgi:hypothetical protein